MAAPQDDRMAEAIDWINDGLASVDRHPLTAQELSWLRSKSAWRAALAVISETNSIDVEPARRLLRGWHAWHQ